MEVGKVKLRIYGMTCGDCVTKISRSLLEKQGVMDVNISLQEGLGEVEFDPTDLKPGDILKNHVFSRNSHYRATLIE
jgi:copper chaperone CopZ